MDNEQFEELITKLTKSVASAVKEDSEAKSVGESIRDTLVQHNESWTSKIKVEQEAKANAEAELEELKNSFKETKEELDALKNEVEAKAAVDLFNDRMNFIDSDYDLNEKELALVTAEVKGLGSSEEDFNSYKEKLEVIFAHKLKRNIEAQEAEIKARIDEAVASRDPEEGVEEVTAEAEECCEEELEVEAEEADASIPNNNADASEQISFVERLKKNFSVEVTN